MPYDPTYAATSGLPSGIGDPSQATQATAFMRQQPWYLNWLAQNYITPGPDQQVRLSDHQRQALKQLAVAHGIGLNHKYDEIDENGQIAEAHHKLKKIAIGAAIGGAALSGFGAAGIGPLAGAFGGATAAGGAGAATIPTTMGIESATALGLPVTAGLGSAGLAGTAGGNGIPNGYPGSDGYVAGQSYPNGIPTDSLLNGNWSPLLKALAGVGGLMGGKALANQGQQNAVPPQLQQLLDLAMQRANAQTPLFNAANKGLYDMLPDFAKKGGG